MVTITVDNSYSRITGLSLKDEKDLKDKLSYIVGGSNSYFSKFGPRKRSLLGKRGDYPSGLNHKVIAFLKNRKLRYEVKDVRVEP